MTLVLNALREGRAIAPTLAIVKGGAIHGFPGAWTSGPQPSATLPPVITPNLVRRGDDFETQIREEVSGTKGWIIVRGELVTRDKADAKKSGSPRWR